MCGGSGGGGGGNGGRSGGGGSIGPDMTTPAGDMTLQQRIDTMQAIKNKQANNEMKIYDTSKQLTEGTIDKTKGREQKRTLREENAKMDARWADINRSFRVTIEGGRRIAMAKGQKPLDLGPMR